jgi:hypothetical protein
VQEEVEANHAKLRESEKQNATVVDAVGSME